MSAELCLVSAANTAAHLNLREHLSVDDPCGGCHTAYCTATLEPPAKCDVCTVKGLALATVSGSARGAPVMSQGQGHAQLCTAVMSLSCLDGVGSAQDDRAVSLHDGILLLPEVTAP